MNADHRDMSMRRPPAAAAAAGRQLQFPLIHTLSRNTGSASLSDKSQLSAAQHLLFQPDHSTAWETMFQGLVAFQRQNNSLAVTRRDYVDGKSLYEWCRNQRKHYLNGMRNKTPNLSEERMMRLESIGFDLNPTGVMGSNDAVDDKRWAAMLQGLREFKKRHGSFSVPRGYLVNGRSLHDWLRHQRTQWANSQRGLRPALSNERRERLESIGFDLDPTGRRQDNRSKDERWDVMFEGLSEFKRKFGNTALPESCYHDGRSLFSWAHHQRRMYANRINGVTPFLSDDRYERLRSIDFDFTSKMMMAAAAANPSSMSSQQSIEGQTSSCVHKRTRRQPPHSHRTLTDSSGMLPPPPAEFDASAYFQAKYAPDEQAALEALVQKTLQQYQAMVRQTEST